MTLRSPMLEFGMVTFTTEPWREGWVKLDVRRLDELQAAAESMAEQGRELAIVGWAVGDSNAVRDLGFAEGAAAVLEWVAGQPADERLVALLDPDGGQ